MREIEDRHLGRRPLLSLSRAREPIAQRRESRRATPRDREREPARSEQVADETASEAGRAVWGRVQECADACIESCLRTFTVAERKDLASMLTRMIAALDEPTPSI